MATTFPSLLRQTKFAAYDPLIHRIYTSPSASAAKGDWGLKYSLPPTKRDRSQYRNIKVQSLDAGQGLGCDYKPGETEARFMERWGNGRYGWKGDDQITSGQSASFLAGPMDKGFIAQMSDIDKGSVDRAALVDQPVVSRAQEKVEPIVDLEFMSEERFEAYLEEVRSRRDDLLAWKQEKSTKAQRAAEQNPGPHDPPFMPPPAIESLWQELAKNKIPSREASEFRSVQLLKDMQANTSGSTTTSKTTPLMPFSHPTGGLAYGDFAPDITSDHPLTILPGRSLAKVSQAQYPFNSNSDALARRSAKNAKGNEQVIGIGGLTATDKDSKTVPFSPAEYAGTKVENRKIDQGVFRVEKAVVERLPTVVASSARTGKKTILPVDLNARFRRAQPATGAKPLDGFGFKVEVRNKSEDKKRWVDMNGGAVVPGEKSWVASDGIDAHEKGSDRLTALMFTKTRNKATFESNMEDKGHGVTADMLKNILQNFPKDSVQSAKKPRGYSSGPSTSFANRRHASSLSTQASRRSFSTSTRRGSSSKDKPTASVTPEQMKGNAEIVGPGVGGSKVENGTPEKPGDDLVKGEWREIEENVAGDVKYGKEQPEGTVKK